MTLDPIYIGSNKARFEDMKPDGTFVSIDKEQYYKISNSDAMRPFFMSIVSDSNHWLFISSNGALTAGRKDCDLALFPYYTDDKITESSEITGSKTIIRAQKNGKTYLWEPFSDRYQGLYNIHRNLYKNVYGNKIIFEEVNTDLGLVFSYQWSSSNQFGFVRKSTLKNTSDTSIKIAILDGLQNILPYGVSANLQNTRSNLVDAYKRSELETNVGLGIYALSAIIVDRAEPSEALKANIAWSTGIDNVSYLLSSLQLEAFRKGHPVQQEVDVKAEKGAYFINTDFTLDVNSDKNWLIVANVNQTITDIHRISKTIKNQANIIDEIQEDIALGTTNLIELAGAADGLQLTADQLKNVRHFSNTLFNIMRGGIFDNNYQIEKSDFYQYINKANTTVFKNSQAQLKALPELFTLSELHTLAAKGSPDFRRLCLEYMPLKFSRRHGDPSRPWNKFSINTRSELDGSKILDYQGNWRDIFQNWEALAISYPEFIESMIHKFLNASTFDGYNPYRVTKDGFDWEVIEENDPWSYIGYWGDHQIIYLQKFLEIIENYYPNKLVDYFNDEVFVYANVPYKIKPYQDILKNPKDTIDFDFELDRLINQKKVEQGADGALLSDKNHGIYHVNFLEKLLATSLAKISNFVPEAGIWMNTQRPEWNDANNALVGNGVSMVTLYYLRRFTSFLKHVVSKSPLDCFNLSEELAVFFTEVFSTLKDHEHTLKGKITDAFRKSIMDGLGQAGSNYRSFIYNQGFAGSKTTVSKAELDLFFELVLKYLDHSIDANIRPDNLYHAYNLISIQNDNEVSISYLNEMLEGQVAILSSGYVSATKALTILDSLKNSALYRADQNSYLLYPNKELLGFLDKNNIPEHRIKASELLPQLLANGNTQIVEQDCLGHYHFNGNFNNANSLKEALNQLPNDPYKPLIEKDRTLLLDIFEEVFDHKSFTGRSGTFFGYEGLGSIYWHMVSKLLLAVQEIYLKAVQDKEDSALIQKLSDHYYNISEGIGVHKSPDLYGAFPTDPYSHTPAGKGAQQPGMTGQVKEDILTRFGELGILVNNGEIAFDPSLLQNKEFLTESQAFNYVDVHHQPRTIQVEKGALCFTYCQVPIIYKRAQYNNLTVRLNNGEAIQFNALKLDREFSTRLFKREGSIDQIQLTIKN